MSRSAISKDILNGHNIHVTAIGSPIGKVPIDSDFDEHLRRFERAIAIAHLFETAYIRIFSFYPPLLFSYISHIIYLDYRSDGRKGFLDGPRTSPTGYRCSNGPTQDRS